MILGGGVIVTAVRFILPNTEAEQQRLESFAITRLTLNNSVAATLGRSISTYVPANQMVNIVVETPGSLKGISLIDVEIVDQITKKQVRAIAIEPSTEGRIEFRNKFEHGKYSIDLYRLEQPVQGQPPELSKHRISSYLVDAL